MAASHQKRAFTQPIQLPTRPQRVAFSASNALPRVPRESQVWAPSARRENKSDEPSDFEANNPPYKKERTEGTLRQTCRVREKKHRPGLQGRLKQTKTSCRTAVAHSKRILVEPVFVPYLWNSWGHSSDATAVLIDGTVRMTC